MIRHLSEAGGLRPRNVSRPWAGPFTSPWPATRPRKAGRRTGAWTSSWPTCRFWPARTAFDHARHGVRGRARGVGHARYWWNAGRAGRRDAAGGAEPGSAAAPAGPEAAPATGLRRPSPRRTRPNPCAKPRPPANQTVAPPEPADRTPASPQDQAKAAAQDAAAKAANPEAAPAKDDGKARRPRTKTPRPRRSRVAGRRPGAASEHDAPRQPRTCRRPCPTSGPGRSIRLVNEKPLPGIAPRRGFFVSVAGRPTANHLSPL